MTSDFLPLTRLSLPPRSLASQTAERLRKDLAASGARPGDRLPGERDLSERYGISRSTVRAALAELADDHHIQASSTRGWFIPEPVEAPPLSVLGFADLAAAGGLPTRARVLHREVRAATVDEAEHLRIAPGAELFTMTRLRYLDEQVVVLEANRVPLVMCPELVTTDFTTASLFDTLRHADPPQTPSVAAYEVEARHPTDDERMRLEITDATPVLSAAQVARNQHGQPVEYTVAVYRADRYRFRGSISN